MVDRDASEVAKKYIMIIPKEIGVKKAFLFGSFAKGNQKEEIDIALVLENITDFFATQMHLMRLRRNIDLRIEPHPIKEQDFNSLNPFAGEISKTGIEILLD